VQGRAGRFVRPSFIPVFGWSYPYVAEPYVQQSQPAAPEPFVATPTGGLRVELQRGVEPQVWVDGYYVGLLTDGVGQVTIDAGVHTVEFHENGYEPLRVDLAIRADELLTYRGELVSAASRVQEPPPAAPAPTTIYVIPGCYVGNVSPRDASLPAGCDPSDAVTVPTQR
jgi:hypothetical protein